ncbi:MAG: ribosomal protein S18-alanine N-acetyltransferase [Erysipelotrichaceae bacterium]|nr:ribosomal protein S18-alanine N-acetyltransferase [Erysipelotrichaceae bacterium]
MMHSLTPQHQIQVDELHHQLHLTSFVNTEGCETFVYLIEDNVVGFISGLVIDDSAELLNIGIDVKHQGQGYGRKLLTQWLDHLIKKNIKTIFCEVRASNTSAIRLYTQCGFKQTRRRKGYYEHPDEDGLEMRYDEQ